MRHFLSIIVGFMIVALGIIQPLYSQKSIEIQISDSLTAIANRYTYVGRINLNGFQINTKAGSVAISANDKLSNLPFRPENVKRIYEAIRHILPTKYSNYSITCQVENKLIEEYIPNFYRKENIDDRKRFIIPDLNQPTLKNLSIPYEVSNGLQNRNIALWQSHGWYYDQKQARWEWQRARVFQIVEDLYTQSYVLPYLAPMLQNAGSNVLIPRERDTQINEVIVDNDTNSNSNKEARYREHNDRKSWKKGSGEGFGNQKKFYIQGENPFRLGTYKTIQAVDNEDESSSAEWYPNFKEAGRYAVYVSYKTLENSASDAHYSIIHRGIKTNFQVNQTMNGGTWVYLGHFQFDKGRNNFNKVVLTNLSLGEDKLISCDAVKFGGGMGNIARNPYEPPKTSNQLTIDSTLFDLTKLSSAIHPETSSYPRYTEGARYWLQWAGMPDSIYSRTKGRNDYSDDFQSRGFWVNYLIGGSVLSPKTKGLNIPVDLALAFHSDAGLTKNDSIIGTLGICSVQNATGKTSFENGSSRWASRDLTDIIQTQLVTDIRKELAPEWTRRGLWNKSYSESRVPEVPTMLLELLSHQNFADMRYGLDPRFRFIASRAIYKGILKYISAAYKTNYVVQPLPVEQFSCQFIHNNKLELHWEAVADSLEPTANADQYILYTRIDSGDFDNGVLINSNRTTLTLQSGKIYSFKICAINKGGQSFPSEILSAYKAPLEKGEVLIINGFDRICAPASFAMDTAYAGFYNDKDAGVPYISDICFLGKQFEFKRDKPWINDDAPGFGASHANFETHEIAGNTFDFPYIHGVSIKAANYSFVSSSLKAILQNDINLSKFKIIDLILGEQKQTYVGNAKKAPEFKTFPLALQRIIEEYCSAGGNIFVSGAYIGSDVCENKKPLEVDKQFIENVLKYKFRTSQASVGGAVKITESPFKIFKKADFSYCSESNKTIYNVESPDAIEPAGDGGYTICRYAENNLSAGIAYSGSYKTFALGFPFEVIETEKDRNKIMESILLFFAGTKKL